MDFEHDVEVVQDVNLTGIVQTQAGEEMVPPFNGLDGTDI